MKSIVIGSTSQQSHYYPNQFLRVSSRNLDTSIFNSGPFDTVVLAFAEQGVRDNGRDFFGTNLTYTMEILRRAVKVSRRVLVFTSCDIWSNCSGIIRPDTPVNYPNDNMYAASKAILFSEIKRNRTKDPDYNRVVVIHPFYFNSIYRDRYFLFGKIFESIISGMRIKVGNLNFYRDMIHTRFFVERCLLSETDCVIGSGKLFNVRDFVVDLYSRCGLSYYDLVEEDVSVCSVDKVIRAGVDWDYTYEDLMRDTLKDLETVINIPHEKIMGQPCR
jgi:nucleoside-diphosphate-sugar epimerase